MRAVITVVGKDTIGIIAKVASRCAEYGANVEEVTQSVLQQMFAMVMLADITALAVPFDTFARAMEELGRETNLVIHAVHEAIFDAMHRI